MNAKGASPNLDYYWSMWIFFSLTFAGLFLSTLGFKYHEMFLAIVGAVFILVMLFAFRHTIPLKNLASTYVGMIGGSLMGAIIGLAVGNIAETLAGIVVGAIIGALVGMIVIGGGLMLLIISVLPGGEVILSRALWPLLIPTGAVAGGIIGAITLRETFIKLLGPTGGGAVAVGTLGIIVGLLLGQRCRKRLG